MVRIELRDGINIRGGTLLHVFLSLTSRWAGDLELRASPCATQLCQTGRTVSEASCS